LAAAGATEERAPRADRGDRGERGEGRRGPRPERAPADAGAAPQAFVDSAQQTEGGEAVSADGERDGRRRRRRGGRDRNDGRTETGAPAETAGLPEHPQGQTLPDAPGAASDEAGEAAADAAAPSGEGSEREGGRRRGRGRDRARREPREGESAAEAAAAAEGVSAPIDALPASPESVAATEPVAVEVVAVDVTPEPAEPVEARPVVPNPAPVATPPVLRPYALPTDELQSIAVAAGLEWVNSDAEKIRAVHEALANEPKPIHVTRQPRPPVVEDLGPLVLVETRKDLSQLALPFEAGAAAAQQPPAA